MKVQDDTDGRAVEVANGCQKSEPNLYELGTNEILELAQNALSDYRRRVHEKLLPNEVPGSKAWKRREPVLASAVLRMLGQYDLKQMTEAANLRGRLNLAEEEAARDRSAIADVRFERDKMRLAYQAAVDVIEMLLASYVDPERLDETAKKRIAEVR